MGLRMLSHSAGSRATEWVWRSVEGVWGFDIMDVEYPFALKPVFGSFLL